MSLKHYFPLSLVVFAAVAVAAHYSKLPVAPFVVILLTGETLMGFQLEDHKVGHLLESMWQTFKTNSKVR